MTARNNKGQFLKGSHWRKPQLFRDKAWLIENYIRQKRSTGDISKQFKVTDASIIFWLRRHGIKRRSVSEARAIKHWGNSGVLNPMWGKIGELSPRWKGGLTPERQRLYSKITWRLVFKEVWQRDKGVCQRCRRRKDQHLKMRFHVHHIRSFKDYPHLRTDANNLILLCSACHHFIHDEKSILYEILPAKRNPERPSRILRAC